MRILALACSCFVSLFACVEDEESSFVDNRAPASSSPISISAGDGLAASQLVADYVKASNTLPTSFFGGAVALSADGSTLAVGSFGEDSAAIGVDGDQTNTLARSSGAVYVYARSGTSWVQQAYVKASNTGANDNFGDSLALSADGSALVVGARFEDGSSPGVNGNPFNNAANNAGAAYVFRRTAGTWAQEAYVKASNPHFGTLFGAAVAISGDGETFAVGSPDENSAATGINGNHADTSATGAGAVYVYRRVVGTWAQEAYVKASNTGVVDSFGGSVALSNDGATLAVGAQFEDSAATGVNGNQLDNSASNAGAAYVFTRSAGTWSQQAYLKAFNTGAVDYFGRKVSLSADGSSLAVSAPGEASAAMNVSGDPLDNSLPDAGAVYLFTRSAGVWSQRAYLKATNTAHQDHFGYSLALSADGTALAVGAAFEDGGVAGVDGNPLDNSVSQAGAVYLYTGFGSAWRPQSYLKPSNPGLGDLLGYSVAISGDGSFVATGAPYEDGSATGVNGPINDAAGDGGAVYVFR